MLFLRFVLIAVSCILFQIIANSNQTMTDATLATVYSSGRVSLSSDPTSNFVSLGRLYESRGTLFHEIQGN